MREILVIDCKERETFWTELKTDCKIIFATTAQRGLKMLSSEVDLVFLSMRLPDMDSNEALRLIKKDFPSTGVIIIASGENSPNSLGMEAWNSESKEADEILRKIKSLLNANEPSEPHPAPLPADITPDENYPDVPSHLVGGILKVRDFVEHNYSESLSLPEACKMASLSKTYFCRFFKCVTGYSLRSYHHYVKMKIAGELLGVKRLSVKDTALKLGYHDANYFSTLYKKFTGISPKQKRDIRSSI